MDDLELRLQQTLEHPSRAVSPVADPVGRVRAGMRRRTRRRAMAGTATAGLAAVAIALAATGNDQGSAPVSPIESPRLSTSVNTPSLRTPPPTLAAVTPSTAGTTAPSTSATIAVPSLSQSSLPGFASLDGFTAVHAAFLDADDGWVIGRAQCDTEPCSVIARTIDGGRTWRALPAPAAIAPEGSMCQDCVASIRFADKAHGYVFGMQLFATASAGQSWDISSPGTRVVALEPRGSDLIRVVAEAGDCQANCAFAVEEHAQGTKDVWLEMDAPKLTGLDARLLRHDSSIYLFADQHLNSGAGSAQTQIAISHDRGETWTQRPDPCTPSDPKDDGEFVATDASVGSDGTLALLCTRRGTSDLESNSNLRVSTDGGKSFGPMRYLYGESSRVAVSSAKSIVVSGSCCSVVNLLRSTDSGRTFTQVLQTERRGPDEDRQLTFINERDGLWIDGPGKSMWLTSDGGATWRERTIG